MKIAIVGAGPAGLATYLKLQKELSKNEQLKERIEISIYESHGDRQHPNRRGEGAPSSGAVYGLAPNGMASLRRLDPKLHERIFRGGFPTPRTIMRSARGGTLGSIPFNDLTGEHPECCVMVMREVVVDALYENIPPSAIVNQKVVGVEDNEDAATITLDSGEKATFDLVIGADGVWSRVRRAISGENDGPEYKGLFSIGGFISTDCLPNPPESGVGAHSQTVMTFGPNGFFGYSPHLTGDEEATEKHIRGDATLSPGKMAVWWSRSEQTNPEADPDDAVIKKELQKRHQSWQDPTIHKVLEQAEIPFKTPTWALPKQPTWTGKRVVLIGDSAHALPSTSGQGVSQSLEDAEALSLLLTHNLHASDDSSSTFKALQKTFNQYTTVRKAHVEKILDMANRMGNTSKEMNVVMEVLMYGMLWVVFRLFGESFLKTVQKYNVVTEVEKVTKDA